MSLPRRGLPITRNARAHISIQNGRCVRIGWEESGKRSRLCGILWKQSTSLHVTDESYSVYLWWRARHSVTFRQCSKNTVAILANATKNLTYATNKTHCGIWRLLNMRPVGMFFIEY
jgi:hypothetical protein